MKTFDVYAALHGLSARNAGIRLAPVFGVCARHQAEICGFKVDSNIIDFRFAAVALTIQWVPPVSFFQISEGYVTKFAPYKALKSIA